MPCKVSVAPLPSRFIQFAAAWTVISSEVTRSAVTTQTAPDQGSGDPGRNTTVDSVSQLCSFHYFADWIDKSGKESKNVKITIYHEPNNSVPATGNAGRGTFAAHDDGQHESLARVQQFACLSFNNGHAWCSSTMRRW
jgi:hypothetical protein